MAAKAWRPSPIGAIMLAVMNFIAPRAWATGLVIASLVVAAEASAKAVAQSPYTLKQTFGTTLRLLRVDLALEVTEKDEEAAYLLFRYRAGSDPKHAVEGAVELVALADDVRVVVKIPSLPEAHERILRDRLVKKLREDYGEPPRRKNPPKPDSGDKPAEPAPPSEPGKPIAPPTEGGKPSQQSLDSIERRTLWLEESWP